MGECLLAGHTVGAPYAVGSYTGDGNASRTLNLGFRPSLLIICPCYVNGSGSSGLWMLYPKTKARSNTYDYDDTSKFTVSWTTTGVTMNDANTLHYFNWEGEVYYYIAFR